VVWDLGGFFFFVFFLICYFWHGICKSPPVGGGQREEESGIAELESFGVGHYIMPRSALRRWEPWGDIPEGRRREGLSRGTFLQFGFFFLLSFLRSFAFSYPDAHCSPGCPRCPRLRPPVPALAELCMSRCTGPSNLLQGGTPSLTLPPPIPHSLSGAEKWVSILCSKVSPKPHLCSCCFVPSITDSFISGPRLSVLRPKSSAEISGGTLYLCLVP